MKINKYKTDKTKASLTSKLLSYGTMASAFVLAGGQANAQCGTADAANPILPIDIDGDGTTDVNINFFSGSFVTSSTNTFPIAPSYNLYSAQIGTLQTSFYVGGNFSYFGCQPAYVPAYFGGGFLGGATFQGDPAWGSYTYVTATGPVNYQVNALNVFSYNFYLTSFNYAYAYASGNGSNQIIGLSAAGSSVCANIDSLPGVSGPNFASLGAAGSYFFYFFNVLAAQSIQYAISGSANIPVPTATCFTSSYATFGIYLPPIPATFLTSVNSSFVTPGPFGLGTPFVTSLAGTFQASGPQYIAVQFISGGETHNGWIEISIDPNTAEITCVNTGYKECSIETAIAVANNPTQACITTGEPSNLEACIPCEPTGPVLLPSGLIRKQE